MSNILEFSRLIDVHRLRPAGGAYEIAAAPAERAALAKRFELLTLDRLEARVQLTPIAAGFYRLSAALQADLTQACVVTLEPVKSHITEEFVLLYGAIDEQKEVVLDDDSETIEPIEGGMIDIGEAVAQQLSLALDPFPRAPGAPAPSDQPPPESQRLASPFAVLAKLRKPKGS
jgi:uncharacterized metal-binding protein YceD (DUF177 family)